MKHAETVTFGGSGPDRAAELRGDLGALIADASTRTILMWRGKPMIHADALVRVALDHPILADAGQPILLGRDAAGAILAHDLSAWEPAFLDETQMGAFLDPTLQVHPALSDDHTFAELRSIMTRLSPRDAELAATAKAIYEWHRTHAFCSRCGQPSEMQMAGWERQCPSCAGKHFPRTDPVVIMLITYGNSVLMGRSPGWPEGMYSLLAGFVEPGETLESAVRRETFEETGVRVGQVDYLASQPWPFPASLMFGCKGVATSDDIEIDPNEIEDAMWVTREEMADAFAGAHPVLKPARKGAIAHFLLRNWLADTLD
ncbi:NAD(+) diphosphatase [Roseobacteraceae bacterium S113]